MPDEHLNVDHFVLNEIESVPHLEALLLLWRTAPQQLSASQIAEQLYVSEAQGSTIAEDLCRRGLIVCTDGQGFFYDTSDQQRNRLLDAVDETYRRELIRISGIIHSKASPSVRAFANAFRLRKD
jgi:hypothetical protein